MLPGPIAVVRRVGSTVFQPLGVAPIGELHLGGGDGLLLAEVGQRTSCWCRLVCVAVALGGTTLAPVQVAAVLDAGCVADWRWVLQWLVTLVGFVGFGMGENWLVPPCRSRPSHVRIGSCRLPRCGAHVVSMLVWAAGSGAPGGRLRRSNCTGGTPIQASMCLLSGRALGPIACVCLVVLAKRRMRSVPPALLGKGDGNRVE